MKKETFIYCAIFAFKTLVFALVLLGLIAGAGLVAEAAAPVMENALWAAYHVIMG